MTTSSFEDAPEKVPAKLTEAQALVLQRAVYRAMVELETYADGGNNPVSRAYKILQSALPPTPDS